MLSDFALSPKVVGVKQSARALREGRAERIFLACDADPMLLEKIESMCSEIAVERGESMAQLGAAAGIAVGAAVVAVLKE